MTKLFIIIALLALGANNAFAQSAEQNSSTEKKKSWLRPGEIIEYQWSDTLSNGRIISVKKHRFTLMPPTKDAKPEQYFITVYRDSHKTPMSKYRTPDFKREYSKIIQRKRLHSIIRSIIQLDSNETNSKIFFAINGKGDVETCTAILEKESYTKNSLYDFSRLIDSINAAKLFPAWHKIAPKGSKDSVEYNWMILEPIRAKANK